MFKVDSRIFKFKNKHDNFSGNDYNSHCQYLCTVGFVLKGDDQRLCQADGRWTGGRPHCEQVISHYQGHFKVINILFRSRAVC